MVAFINDQKSFTWVYKLGLGSGYSFKAVFIKVENRLGYKLVGIALETTLLHGLLELGVVPEGKVGILIEDDH